MAALDPRGVRAGARPRRAAKLESVLAFDNPPNHGDHLGSAYQGSWYGYVSKDLRKLFGPRPRGAYSRVYCGRGSRKRCRSALRGALRRALRVKRADLYGRDETCADENRVEASCFDETRSTIAAGVDIPPFPWINRPTFQQTIELRRHLPR